MGNLKIVQLKEPQNGMMTMDNDIVFDGFVLLNDGTGLHTVEIRKDGEFVNVWIGGDLADDIGNDVEEFEDAYGTDLYETLQDFREGHSIAVAEVWPK